MSNPVLAALAQARLRAAPLFARWCELSGQPFCPAQPATVAQFVRESAGLGIPKVWPALQDISRLHASLGLADPTLGEPAASAVNDVAGLAPPRSWPAGYKDRFKALPYDLQCFIAEHEVRRDKALRRAQNEAATVRQKLSALQEIQASNESSKSSQSSPRHADT
jgi:hypothetical protein